MLTCHVCSRHVRVDEHACPFCDAPLEAAVAPSPARLSTMAVVAGLAMLACADRGAGTSETGTDSAETNTQSGSGPSESGSEGATTTTDTSESSSSTTGDGDGDTNEETVDWGGADYGGPTDDGSEVLCDEFGADPLVLGPNPVEIVDGPSLLQSSCGADGPESIHYFIGEADAVYHFELTDATFAATLYLVDTYCEPLAEIGCANAPEPVETLLTEGLAIYVVVDSNEGAGTATLEVSQL